MNFERQAFVAGIRWASEHLADVLNIAATVRAAQAWAYPERDAVLLTEFCAGAGIVREALTAWDDRWNERHERSDDAHQ